MENKIKFMNETVEICARNGATIKTFCEKVKAKEEITWKDTIHEIFSFDNYTLLMYSKGGNVEYNIAYCYDRETKTWASGNYCFSLEEALVCCLRKMDSFYLKSRYQTECERENEMSYDRLTELATLFKDGLIEDDRETAMEYFEETCEMTEQEMEFFGIENEEEEEDEE